MSHPLDFDKAMQASQDGQNLASKRGNIYPELDLGFVLKVALIE